MLYRGHLTVVDFNSGVAEQDRVEHSRTVFGHKLVLQDYVCVYRFALRDVAFEMVETNRTVMRRFLGWHRDNESAVNRQPLLIVELIADYDIPRPALRERKHEVQLQVMIGIFDLSYRAIMIFCDGVARRIALSTCANSIPPSIASNWSLRIATSLGG